MDLKNKAESIISHGVRLGIPPEFSPDKAYFEKIIRARSTKLLDNLLNRVKHKNQIELIRKNLLVQAARDEKRSNRNQLPAHFARFLDTMETNSKIKAATKIREKTMKYEKILLDEIFNDDIQKTKSSASFESKELTLNILQAKNIVLEENIEREFDTEKKILLTTPAKFSVGLKIEDMNEAIRNALLLLRNFYSDLETTDSAKLWLDIKTALASTPNIFLFQSVFKQIKNFNSEFSNLHSNAPQKEIHSLAEHLIPKLHRQLTVCCIELLSQKSQLRIIKTSCSEVIKDLVSQLEKSVNTTIDYSFQYEDDTVEEYVPAVLQNLDLQGKIHRMRALLSELKHQIEGKDVRDYEATVQDLRLVQEKLEEKVLNLQQTIGQTYQINEKLNFGKISMLHLVQDIKTTCKLQEMNRTMMNLSLIATPMQETSTPAHREELQNYLSIPVEKFDMTSKIVSFELDRKSHQIFFNDEAVIALIRNCDFDLTRLNKSLQSMEKTLEMSKKLRSTLTIVEPKLETPTELSMVEMKNQLNENRDEISELLDQISKCNVTTKSQLRDMQTIYKYLIKNPCKRFIPASKKFEKKSYKDYENDFNLYYKMFRN